MTITRRILLQVALATVAVITVATAAAYYFVRRSAENHAISFLYDYVQERGRVQEAQLKRVEQNLRMVRELFLDRDARPVTSDVEKQWQSRNELSPDGAWRTRRDGFDPRRRSSTWVSRDAPMTFALKTRVLRAENILNDFILGWVDDFPSLYFIFPQQVNVGYDARIPNWVWDAKADYDTCAAAFFQEATPERNPEGRIVWGAAMREPVSQVPYVSVTLPIRRGAEFIGIVGHDIAVSDLLASTARPGLQGVTTFLMRRDGRLIAHPRIQPRILDSDGTLTMDQTGDPALRAIYRGSQMVPKEQDLFGGSLENNTVHFAAVQWQNPAWLFVGVLSYEQLRADAFRSARWVLWSGLGSLALVLGLFAWILRRQVAAPLAELARATRQMSTGDIRARASVLRNDELGALADSFNTMAERVAERDGALRAEKASLEQRVSARVRPLRLNAELASALNEISELQPMLQRCAELLVQHLDAAFARVWILNEGAQRLELHASAGCYTHLDGAHSRVPVGQFKIGLIAQEKRAHLSNDVASDDRVSDKEWARREGMVAFAGYPLLLEGRVLGVVAIFARRLLGEDVIQALDAIAHSLALGVERKRAEARLRESEARFSKAFRANPAMMALTRMADGKFLAANEAFYQTTGYTEPEVIGRRSIDLNIYAVPQQRDEYVNLIRAHGFVRDREHQLRTKDGRLRTVLSSGERIDLEGEPHLLTVGLDITARKEAEIETMTALAREQELGELKTRFVSMVSHEFRTPLEVIVSSADILDLYLDRLQAAERSEHLAAIQGSVKRMSVMMEDVLLLGRFESHRQQFSPDDLHLAALCRRLSDEMRSATAGRCPIELSLDDTLPLARADEKLLRHILTNLLSNAIKYSQPGAPVRLFLTREDHNAVLRVEDRGLGIPAADQARMFEAFQRGGNTSEIAGTGLGLVIVKRSVELHGGTIDFTSEEGQGTTFTVRLPVFNPTEP